MTPEMEIARDHCYKFMSHMIETTEEVHAQGFLFDAMGNCINMYLFHSAGFTRRAKDAAALMLLKDLVAHPKHVAAFASDFFGVESPPGMTLEEVERWRREEVPDDLADLPPELRIEGLICAVNAMGQQGQCFVYPYERRKKEIVWKPRENYISTTGRFIYDLAFNDWKKAAVTILRESWEVEPVKQ